MWVVRKEEEVGEKKEKEKELQQQVPPRLAAFESWVGEGGDLAGWQGNWSEESEVRVRQKRRRRSWWWRRCWMGVLQHWGRRRVKGWRRGTEWRG